MNMRKMILTLGICLLAVHSGAQVTTSSQIDPSKVKFLLTRCGPNSYGFDDLWVGGVVANDIDLADDNIAKGVVRMAKTFIKETCPGQKNPPVHVFLWSGDPATLQAERFAQSRDKLRDVGDAYKESNHYDGYSQYNEAVNAWGPLDEDVRQYENRIQVFKERQARDAARAAAQKKADDERRAQEKVAAEAREREYQARAAAQKKLDDERRAQERVAAEAAQKRRVAKTDAFMQRVGTKQVVQLFDLCRNPFPYQGKTVVFSLTPSFFSWEWKAITATSVVISDVQLPCSFVLNGIPANILNSQFRGAVLMAVKPLGNSPQGTLLLQYVHYEHCAYKSCRDFALPETR